MPQAVSMPSLMMMTLIVSEESLARDRYTHSNTHAHTHTHTHTHTHMGSSVVILSKSLRTCRYQHLLTLWAIFLQQQYQRD